MRSYAWPGRLAARLPKEDRGGGSPGAQPASSPAPAEQGEPVIVCRACAAAVTRPQEAVAMAGAHRHTFANPHGIVFEIACFADAPGCTQVGAATDEFTWFAGYDWRIAICGTCHEHLGWRFQADGGGFYGLIVDRLIFPS
jgi:hypothetical protein